jgi:hypothetical protein
MRRLIATAILIAWPTCFVWASVNASGSITAGGTYQQVFAANPTRTGCSIENNSASAHNMFIYAGATANATHTNSLIVVPGAMFNCTIGFGVQNDQISIDGTTADPFYASQW